MALRSRTLTKQIAAEDPRSKEHSSPRPDSRAFCRVSKGRSGHGCAVSAVRPEKSSRLFARSLSFVRQTEKPASLHFRLRNRWRTDFSLRRRWRRGRQIFALHRIDQFAVCGPADGCAGIGTRRHALGQQFGLRPCRRCYQQNCKYKLLHRAFSPCVVRPIEPDRPREVHKAYLVSRKRLSLFACRIFGPKIF
jgi:hypothetical protein